MRNFARAKRGRSARYSKENEEPVSDDVKCPLCGGPAIEVIYGGIRLIGCDCVEKTLGKDRAVCLQDLDPLGRGTSPCPLPKDHAGGHKK